VFALGAAALVCELKLFSMLRIWRRRRRSVATKGERDSVGRRQRDRFLKERRLFWILI
jgi:hypothetical protein